MPNQALERCGCPTMKPPFLSLGDPSCWGSATFCPLKIQLNQVPIGPRKYPKWNHQLFLGVGGVNLPHRLGVTACLLPLGPVLHSSMPALSSSLSSKLFFGVPGAPRKLGGTPWNALSGPPS